jgi:hypothetical protein
MIRSTLPSFTNIMANPTPGNTFTTAGKILSYQPSLALTGSLTPNDFDDYYRFTVDSRSTLNLGFAGSTPTSVTAAIYDYQFNELSGVGNGSSFNPGVYYIRIQNNTAVTNSISYTLNYQLNVQGDPVSLIQWTNNQDGRNAIWLMGGTSNTTRIEATDLSQVAKDWYVEGVADFNRDAIKDIVWRNRATGRTDIWYMGGLFGNTRASTVTLTPVSADWQLGGVGDVNGDGIPDLFWRNQSNGRTDVWSMGGSDGSTRISSTTIATVGAPWEIEKIGDLNGDGVPDIFWYNTANGRHDVWLMGGASNTTRIASQTLLTNANWRIEGIADFSEDQRPDIVWRNPSLGRTDLWVMGGDSNTTLINSQSISPAVSTNWRAFPLTFSLVLPPI